MALENVTYEKACNCSAPSGTHRTFFEVKQRENFALIGTATYCPMQSCTACNTPWKPVTRPVPPSAG